MVLCAWLTVDGKVLKTVFLRKWGFMMRLPAAVVAATVMNCFSWTRETTNTGSSWLQRTEEEETVMSVHARCSRDWTLASGPMLHFEYFFPQTEDIRLRFIWLSLVLETLNKCEKNIVSIKRSKQTDLL